MTGLRGIFEATEELNRQVILETCLPRPGARLLDLGCGTGEFTVRVAAQVQAAESHGVELLEDWAAAARDRGIDVVLSDLGQRLPYEDDFFDVVHSNQVIEHMRDTDHFVSEVRRVLRPGGYAVISTNNLSSWHNVISLTLGWQPPPCHVSDEVIVGNPANFQDGVAGYLGQMHLRLFTARALAELAAHHGLDVEADRGAGSVARLDRRHAAFLVQRLAIARS
jgi:methionine biosynthesis protein MetW